MNVSPGDTLDFLQTSFKNYQLTFNTPINGIKLPRWSPFLYKSEIRRKNYRIYIQK